VITKLNDRVIRDPDTLIAAVRSHSPGERVTVTSTAADGGAPHTSDVVLGGQKS
jgi:putative serine protease PepD